MCLMMLEMGNDGVCERLVAGTNAAVVVAKAAGRVDDGSLCDVLVSKKMVVGNSRQGG